MYDSSQIYNQIVRAWEKKGCKNAKQFCEYAEKQGYHFTQQTISRWKNNTIPDTRSLLDICNVCGCDISYLIGNIHSDITYGITYIHEVTGLREETIEQLKELNSFSHSSITSLCDLIEHGFLLSVCNAITRNRIQILTCKKPKLPKDILDFTRTVFNLSEDEKGDVDTDNYLANLSLSIYELPTSTIDSWNDCDFSTISETYAPLNSVPEDLTTEEALELKIKSLTDEIDIYTQEYETTDTTNRLIAKIFLATVSYLQLSTEIERGQDMIIPRKFNRTLDEYLDSLKSKRKL